MIKTLRRFLKDDAGATAIEYVVIGCIISLAIVASTRQIGTTLSGTLSNLAKNL